jgi:hypothetical protein
MLDKARDQAGEQRRRARERDGGETLREGRTSKTTL